MKCGVLIGCLFLASLVSALILWSAFRMAALADRHMRRRPS